MAKPVKIKGLDELFKKLDPINIFDSERTLSKMAAYGKTKILSRTSSGKDYLNRPFKPYTEAYKQTRSKLGLPSKKPDLFKTGRMLGSLSFYLEKDEAHLFFLNPQESLKAYVNNKIRNFFEFNDKDEKGMLRIAETDIKKALK